MTTEIDSLPRLENAFVDIVAKELGLRPHQVKAADGLFADGCTVPFVARYRKEATGGVDDAALEEILKRREYFVELAGRRDTVLANIEKQGKLSPELAAAIRAAVTKRELEDLYLPYRPRRRNRAQIARGRGLEPLAEALLEGAHDTASLPSEIAVAYIDPEKEIGNADDAISGARDILAERLSEVAEHREHLRTVMTSEGQLRVTVVPGREKKGAVYRDYFDHAERFAAMASHRLLAVLRGEKSKVLTTHLEIDDDSQINHLAGSWNVPLQTPCGQQILEATRDGYRRLLRPSITNEVRASVRDGAATEATRVFRDNLGALLMQPPFGQAVVMGIDPGFRTGCKIAVVDGTGKVVATSTIFPTPPAAKPEESAKTIVEFVQRYGVRAIAIGNGTGSRETESFTQKVVKEKSEEALGHVVVAIVPETGASVYSASALAREELPELDVAHRGAASIARRLQDPLAELVKIDPKSLGVGQYQHDVNRKSLARELDLTVEGVVNRVGVELNTASHALLSRVSGLSNRLAREVVAYRDTHGSFPSRTKLLDVSGFGPKAFEQAAGFLRIRDEEVSLDGTAVHPERYDIVEAMARDLGLPVSGLIGNSTAISRIQFDQFINAEKGVGKYTLDDIRAELERPCRDPRPDFRVPEWRDDVQSVKDLKPEMVLEGRVSNVTNFGAFVDIGVKRDGLVHLSELAHRWVQDPRQVASVGQVVKVKVLQVDTERGRITLSMKALEPAPARRRAKKSRRRPGAGAHSTRQTGPTKTLPAEKPGNKTKSANDDSRSTEKSATREDLDDLLSRFKRQW